MPSQRDQEGFQERHDLLQAVLDSLTHPLYVVDVADYQIRLANRAARKVRASGTATCYALVHGKGEPCAGPNHPCPVQIVKETGRPTVVEHVHHDEEGPRTFEVHAFPIHDGTGQVAQVIEYCIDVTEHKQVVEQLQWELAVNRAIVDLADALIDPSSSIAQIADIVLEQARRLTRSEHGFVSSIDPETGDATSHTLTHMMGSQCGVAPEQQAIVFHCGPDGRYPGLWGYALNTLSAFYSNAPAAHCASTGVPAGHIPLCNFLTVPALVGENVVGQIALANADEDYCERHLEAIGRMAKLYALAVQRWHGDLALKTSEERYALAQAAANIGSWDWNISTGKLLWSDRIEPMFGFARGQFKATYEAFLECVHPDDRALVEESVTACVENRQDYRVEHRVVWLDGTVRWVSETGDVIRDSHGKAVRMLGVVQDITEHKKAESQIRDLAKFPSENPSPVMRIRRDGTVLYSNRPGQTLMQKWKTQPGRPMPHGWDRRVAAVWESDHPAVIEEECEGRIFSLVLVPLAEAGYINIYGRDITDHKRVEYEVRKLNQGLERRVLARTGELTEANRQLREEFRRRRRLEREILEISEREQRRIGRELHDSLGQLLTGVAIMTKALEQTLQRQDCSEAADAKQIGALVNQAIEETRQLSRGLHPVSLDENGLMSALQALAATTQSLFRVACAFECSRPVLVPDASTAVHLYRIAQEAVTNAVRHGLPRSIRIELDGRGRHATLLIVNDGRDFPETPPEHKGMGLQVMRHRAEMIGGTLDVRRGSSGGTELRCTFEIKPQGEKEHG